MQCSDASCTSVGSVSFQISLFLFFVDVVAHQWITGFEIVCCQQFLVPSQSIVCTTNECFAEFSGLLMNGSAIFLHAMKVSYVPMSVGLSIQKM